MNRSLDFCEKCGDGYEQSFGGCPVCDYEIESEKPVYNTYPKHEIDLLQSQNTELKDKLSECIEALIKYERVIKYTHKICLCERFNTEGFDYHEKHPNKELNNGASRPNTPRDFIEAVIGFKWEYDDSVKPYNSWKELQFDEALKEVKK